MRRLPSPASLIALALLAPASLAQHSDRALRFFGTGTSQQDRVRIPIDDDVPGAGSSPCDVGAGGFTIEFWIRGTLADNPTSADGEGSYPDFRWIFGNIVVDRDIWGGSDRDFGISFAGGRVRFGTGAGDAGTDGENTIEGSVNVLDGTWRHVACVRDAASGRKSVYVDGALDFQSPAGTSQTDLSYPDAGVPGQMTPWGPYIVLAAEKHDAGSSFPSFRGRLDEVRVWSIMRPGAQIAASWNQLVAPGIAGLAGSWRLEEGAGTTVFDTSGLGPTNGELIAGVAGNGEWVAYASDPSNTAPVQASAIRSYCVGDGTAAACPCGNESPSGSGRGCLSSLGQGGLLSASGAPSVAADTLVLVGSGMPDSLTIYIQATGVQSGGLGLPFADGIRCTSGSSIRLGAKQNSGGASSYPEAGDPSISVRGAIPAAGGLRHYQVWYRNPPAYCTAATTNLSNGSSAFWSP